MNYPSYILKNLIMQTWQDAFLKWNPKNFDGVEQVRIPIDEIWTPDIVLYN